MPAKPAVVLAPEYAEGRLARFAIVNDFGLDPLYPSFLVGCGAACHAAIEGFWLCSKRNACLFFGCYEIWEQVKAAAGGAGEGRARSGEGVVVWRRT